MESKIFAKLNFDPGILVILSLILTVVAIVLVIMLVLRQSRLEMNYKIFMKGKNGKTLEDTFKAQFDDIDLVVCTGSVKHFTGNRSIIDTNCFITCFCTAYTGSRCFSMPVYRTAIIGLLCHQNGTIVLNGSIHMCRP